MKHYIDYTTEELDTLYANLSETAQDFVYGDIAGEEVSIIGKKTGLHLDKWEDLNTLVIETILGIVPSGMFASEVSTRLGTTPEITSEIVSHMDENIFSVMRDESIEGYAETNEKNISVGAIYDEAQDVISDSTKTDPYRESADLPHTRGPVITEEKLHIVDELFAVHSPNIKPLTPEDGSVRVPTAEAPVHRGLFGSKVDNAGVPASIASSADALITNIPVSPLIITREMIEAEERASRGAGGSFVGMENIEKKLEAMAPIKETIPAAATKEKLASLPVEKSKSKIKLHIEKVPAGNISKIKIHIEKVGDERNTTSAAAIAPTAQIGPISVTPSLNQAADIPKKLKPTDGPHPSDTVPHSPNPHYTVDPYKEVL